MAIRRTKRIDLSQFSSEWKDSYIEVSTMGFKAIQEYSKSINKLLKKEDDESSNEVINKMISLAQGQFISGKIVDEGKLRDLAKEDMVEFDQEILEFVIKSITGQIGKKV